MKKISEAVSVALKKHNLKQIELAQICDVPHSEITRLLFNDKKPNDELFKKLCTCWPYQQTGLEVLRAHIEDEIARAGRTPEEVKITVLGDNPEARDIEADFALLRDARPGAPNVRECIGALAQIIRESRRLANKPSPYPQINEAPLRVAEEDQLIKAPDNADAASKAYKAAKDESERKGDAKKKKA